MFSFFRNKKIEPRFYIVENKNAEGTLYYTVKRSKYDETDFLFYVELGGRREFANTVQASEAIKAYLVKKENLSYTKIVGEFYQ